MSQQRCLIEDNWVAGKVTVTSLVNVFILLPYTDQLSMRMHLMKLLLSLTKCEGNNVEQRWLAMAIHHVQSYISD